MSGGFITLGDAIPQNQDDFVGFHYGFWANEYAGRLWFVLLARELSVYREPYYELSREFEKWTHFLIIPPNMSYIGDNSGDIFNDQESRAYGAAVSNSLISTLRNTHLTLLDFYPMLRQSEFYRHCSNPDCSDCLTLEQTFNSRWKHQIIDVGEHFVRLLEGKIETGESCNRKAGNILNIKKKST